MRVSMLLLAVALPVALRAAEPLDFNRDIRPILVQHCVHCHGPDEKRRQGELRLDERPSAVATAIVPGKRDASPLWRKITATDPDERMPPAEYRRPLNRSQIELLGKWIDAGAPWAEHWAYVAPRRPRLPAVKETDWPRNAIDFFTLAKRERDGDGRMPAEPTRAALLRRVTFDLTGLPPTNAELDEFLADSSPDAYERAVERLLQSPRYAERMTLEWLDAARYADTHGYHIDAHRDMWRWRDWVLDAFAHNMPFDQFTIEQLAGDLLPNPTLEQLIATGFHRNTMVQSEDGALDDEFLVEYAADRVVTTGVVWLGQSLQCARCHSHKHDPFTQRDFFRLFAYFNNVPENGIDGREGNAQPFIPAPTLEQRRQQDELQREASQLESSLAQRVKLAAAEQLRWEEKQPRPASFPGSKHLLAYFPFDEVAGGKTPEVRFGRAGRLKTETEEGGAQLAPGKFGQALLFDGESWIEDATGPALTDRFAIAAWVFPTTEDELSVVSCLRVGTAGPRQARLWLREGRLFFQVTTDGKTTPITVRSRDAVTLSQWQSVAVSWDGTANLFLDGRRLETEAVRDAEPETPLDKSPEQPVPLTIGREFRGLLDEVRIYGASLSAEQIRTLATSSPIDEILLTRPSDRSARQSALLAAYYREHHDAAYRQLADRLGVVRRRQAELEKLIPTTMVMRERTKPKPTFILNRGDYRFPTERVQPGTPASLPPLPTNAPPNRLALAKWLVDPAQPLTARVIVNRYWQMYFGVGLVATPEDFGTRGATPTDPELLDWLVTEFIRGGWDVKQMQRLIVTSATYRRLATRRRLPAEFVRDQALFVGGLLQERFGGRSVFPYQPPGLWEELSFDPNEYTAQVYTPSRGRDLYRRGLYSFWKRSSPPPGMTSLDAPDRETCTVRRSRSNTPLQALVLLNDPTFVEAARGLAERIVSRGGNDPAEQVRFAFRTATSRWPKPAETALLLEEYRQQRAEFTANRSLAEKLLRVGDSRSPTRLDIVELASWTAVANLLLNLDEVISRP